MSCYVPACAVPTGVPTYVPSSSSPVCYPVGGVGSLGSGGTTMSSGGGSGGSGGSGATTTAASLGLVPGASVSCINQIPASQVVIQPAPVMVTLPGAVLSPSCEPVRVGGYTACAPGSSGSPGRTSRYTCRPYICRS